jgi:hypothetical protein
VAAPTATDEEKEMEIVAEFFEMFPPYGAGMRADSLGPTNQLNLLNPTNQLKDPLSIKWRQWQVIVTHLTVMMKIMHMTVLMWQMRILAQTSVVYLTRKGLLLKIQEVC